MKKTQYEKEIEAIIKYAGKTRGFIAELHRQFQKLAERKVHRQECDSWLNKNAAERVVPNAITGELLIAAGIKARLKMEKGESK